MSEPPVHLALSRLQDLGIALEITRRQRGRIYVYDEYLTLVSEDTTRDGSGSSAASSSAP